MLITFDPDNPDDLEKIRNMFVTPTEMITPKEVFELFKKLEMQGRMTVADMTELLNGVKLSAANSTQLSKFYNELRKWK